MKMRFVFPCQEYEQKAIEFIQEFREISSETNGDGGLSGFLEKATYQDWLVKIQKDVDIANIPDGRVPQFTYFYVSEDEDRIVGMIAIRSALNDFLRTEGGHIGYCIRPTERRKGHGTNMLREALAFCSVIGLRDIIVSCDKENVASAGIIKKCGGILDAEFYSNFFKATVQRYHITV
jgi:predicted acetyltransferase